VDKWFVFEDETIGNVTQKVALFDFPAQKRKSSSRLSQTVLPNQTW